jgi:hypothetical protein
MSKYILMEILKYKQTKTAKQLILSEIAKIEKEENKLHFDRLNNDVNGNPRYVIHFTSCKPFDGASYEETVRAMNKIGGRKYHNKSYGGGIVFQSYSLESTENAINDVKNKFKSEALKEVQ